MEVVWHDHWQSLVNTDPKKQLCFGLGTESWGRVVNAIG